MFECTLYDKLRDDLKMKINNTDVTSGFRRVRDL